LEPLGPVVILDAFVITNKASSRIVGKQETDNPFRLISG
jgi:hypothetical protein